jgi:hypothetical protein
MKRRHGFCICLFVCASVAAAEPNPAPQAVAPLSQAEIKALIDQLDDTNFKTRQKAVEMLEKADEALPALREARAARRGVDFTRRVEQLITRIEDRPWAELDKAKATFRHRLTRLLHPKLKHTDRQVIRAIYLLTLVRTPTEMEQTAAEKQLRRSTDRPWAVRQLALALLKGKECNADVVDIGARLLELQMEAVNMPLADRLQKLNGEALVKLAKESSTKLLKAAKGMSDREIGEMVFLLTVSREAAKKELATIEQHVKKDKKRESAFADIFWAIANCNEFMRDPYSGSEK